MGSDRDPAAVAVTMIRNFASFLPKGRFHRRRERRASSGTVEIYSPDLC